MIVRSRKLRSFAWVLALAALIGSLASCGAVPGAAVPAASGEEAAGMEDAGSANPWAELTDFSEHRTVRMLVVGDRPSDMDEVLEIEGYPTTVFVGRSGEILACPISGVPSDISRYETTIEALLAGDGAAISDSSDATVGTVPGDGSTYNVIVRDSEGDPVKGVAVQFCSDTSCMVGKTDADGVASFEADEGMVYTIHILKVPEGVEKTNEEFSTLDVYSDTYVILQKTA